MTDTIFITLPFFIVFIDLMFPLTAFSGAGEDIRKNVTVENGL